MTKLVAIPILALVMTLPAHGQNSQRNKQGVAVPTVNFCDFTIHPKRYAGKRVRVKATLVAWWESSYLYSPTCETDAKKIHNALDCSGQRDCKRVGDAARREIERVGKPGEYDSYKATLILVGRLVGPSRIGFGHLNGFKFEFRIRSARGPSNPAQSLSAPHMSDSKGDTPADYKSVRAHLSHIIRN